MVTGWNYYSSNAVSWRYFNLWRSPVNVAEVRKRYLSYLERYVLVIPSLCTQEIPQFRYSLFDVFRLGFERLRRKEALAPPIRALRDEIKALLKGA